MQTDPTQGIEYLNEHLQYGTIGNIFVILSFVFALLSSISYFFASKDNDESLSWKRIARAAFRLHGLSVFGIVGTLFIMLYNHYFEYEYVWHHSNNAMPMRYILSCFWEGQEGSFLLWTFWHVVIGLVLQRSAKTLEAPVMTVISLVQTFLASMLLGIYIYEHKIGSNPFTILLRESPDYINSPIVRFLKYGIKPIEHPKYFTDPLKSFPNYLALIDGKGLNPLLQNYWMTIHPPTLFLGFALTVVPFAYAIAGLWKKRLTDWIKPALPWAFIGVAVLGVGILMGGAWAYESLSFGGFWAWDPVENASLVPWLTLVATAHLLLINRNKAQSLFISFFLAILTFALILYSTFLTRSGILGDSSVHAFTDLGMSGQLLIYLFFFIYLGIMLMMLNTRYKIWFTLTSLFCLIIGYILSFYGLASLMLLLWFLGGMVLLIICFVKFYPKPSQEEGIWSREFWMFVGAIVLIISSFQIMFYTSLPVWNKLFNKNWAANKDVLKVYHPWQIPFAIIVTILIAVGQYFKYKNTDMKSFINKISISFVTSFCLTVLAAFLIRFSNPIYTVLLFSCTFAAIANLDYMVRVLKGKVKKAGPSIAHIGFALVLLGALLSTSKKDIISQNTSGKSVENLGEKFSNNDNILLTMGDTLPMGKYYVTFIGKRFEGINVYFDVDYFTRDEKGKLNKAFTLSPLVQTNPRMGNVAEPDTRHFLNFDVYTHITYADLESLKEKQTANKDEYSSAKNFTIKQGDTIFSSNSIIIFDSLSTVSDKASLNLGDKDIAVKAHLRALDVNNKTFSAEPVFIIRNNSVQPVASKVDGLGLQFMFWKINPDNGKIDISLQEKKANVRDYIVMQAIIFPYINVLWIGCIVMLIGTLLAILERIRKRK